VNIDNRRLAEITAVQGASLTGRRQAARSGPATISPGRQPRCPPRGGWGDLPTCAIAQHLRRAGVAERPQLLQGRFTVIGKRPNRIESALRPWPKGPDQGNREIADPAAEEGKQRERVLIGPVNVIEQQQGRRWQRFEKLKGCIQTRRPCLDCRSPADPGLAGAPEAESTQRLVDDPKGETRFSGIAPSNAGFEVTA